MYARNARNSSSSPPLQWPDGWPRTKARLDGCARFSTGNGPVEFAAAREKLATELRLLRATSVVISFNRTERDAYDYDPGVAVYFMLNGRQKVIARDRFCDPADNLRSIGLAIQAMRQLQRHGGDAMMDRAFTGFEALPPPRSCWETLGVTKGVSREEINYAYRLRAKEAHPDNGGSNKAMVELNQARDEALGSIP